ncbi:hypothetical protein SK066_02665 [Paenibacillus hunanensis]|nr:hypothetical protein [Paenibacillus hunanensis]WPP41885.1 hypothetical protein SK066_02665 [Paenibacillus hunanensis]
MKISLKPSYGVIKHNETNEQLARLVHLFVADHTSLLFSFYERNLHLYDVDIQKFILDRCLFVNSNWVLPWEETIPYWDEGHTRPNIIWFAITNIEDIVKAIEIDNLFKCVILERGKEFDQYSNVLFHEEYHPLIDEEDDYDYYLGFTNKEEFFNKVQPRITGDFDLKGKSHNVWKTTNQSLCE